jgi:hypothetical protein
MARITMNILATQRPAVDSLQWTMPQTVCSSSSRKITLCMTKEAMQLPLSIIDHLSFTTSTQLLPRITGMEEWITLTISQMSSAITLFLMICLARVQPCLVDLAEILSAAKGKVESWTKQRMMIQGEALLTRDRRWKKLGMGYSSLKLKWRARGKEGQPSESRGLQCTTRPRIVPLLTNAELTQVRPAECLQGCHHLILII